MKPVMVSRILRIKELKTEERVRAANAEKEDSSTLAAALLPRFSSAVTSPFSCYRPLSPFPFLTLLFLFLVPSPSPSPFPLHAF